MCLRHNPERTRKLAAKLRKQEHIIGYKILRVVQYIGYKRLESHYYSHTWKSGWNKSHMHKQTFIHDARSLGWHRKEYKSVLYKNVCTYTAVKEGIHVFTNKQTAEYQLAKMRMNATGLNRIFVIVPVKCYGNDLVSAGYDNGNEFHSHSAVFTRVYLEKEDKEKALKAI